MSSNIPNDPIQALLAQTTLKSSLFTAASRYFGLEPQTIHWQGRDYVYLPRRFVPSPARFQLLHEHAVIQGERLDHIAARYFGDPTLFWRVCDANGAIRPEALTEQNGKTLRITLSEGIAGNPL